MYKILDNIDAVIAYDPVNGYYEITASIDGINFNNDIFQVVTTYTAEYPQIKYVVVERKVLPLKKIRIYMTEDEDLRKIEYVVIVDPDSEYFDKIEHLV